MSKYLEMEIERLNQILNLADTIILDIHAQITTYSKYTAYRVYNWKDIRGKSGIKDLRDFDDNGRDEGIARDICEYED